MKRDLIRPLKRFPKTYYFKRIIVYDVETTSEERPRFILAYAVFRDGRYRNRRLRYHFFRTRSGLTKFILSKVCGRPLYVFAHNASFDFSFLDHDMLLHECELKHVSVNPFIIRFKCHKGGSITFLDTTNWFKQSLESLFPNEKVKVDFDNEVSLEMLKKRCKKDVQLTMKLALNVFGVSASDMSFKTFRHENRVYIQKITTPLAEKSYYGGRVECYVSHTLLHNIKAYDFNSLFPAVMRNPVPIKYVQTVKNPSIDFVKECMHRGFFVFADVTVNVPDMFIPPLPYRYKGKLIFPTGYFRTCVAQPELEIALEMGVVKKVHEIEIYYAKEIFKEFVEKYYTLRKIDKANTLFYKLILNSLYGKFGQKFHVCRLLRLQKKFTGAADVILGRRKCRGYFLNGQGFMLEEKGRKYSVAVSAAIASYGRAKLYRKMQEINYNVVYVDTDSVFTSSEIPTGDGLGDMKLEREGDFIGFRAKCYIHGDIVKFKGGRVEKEQLLNACNEIEVHNRYFSTLREYIKSGQYVIVDRVKKFDLVDDKRCGTGVTKPININQIEKFIYAQ